MYNNLIFRLSQHSGSAELLPVYGGSCPPPAPAAAKARTSSAPAAGERGSVRGRVAGLRPGIDRQVAVVSRGATTQS